MDNIRDFVRVRRSRRLVCLTLVGALVVASGAFAAESSSSDSLDNLIDGGEVALSFRYRFEHVDDDAFSEEADASTLRSRLSLQSGAYRDFDFFIEVEDVHEVFWDDFNAGQGNTPSRTEYPVVADPEGTEINQVYVDYNGFEDWSVRVGRQRINLDNQRFVGGVGWRQNEQTYDALKIGYQSDAISGTYAFVTKVRRIFGDDVPAGKHEQDGTHLLNVSGDISGIGKLAGYYYRIDNDDAASFSTSTIGARLTGSQNLDEDLKIRYAAEFASQSDAENNPDDYSANYWSLDAGVVFGIFDVGIGWEVLEGDADSADYEAFRTPFATLHAFNGWADKFLGTPAAGLDDKYLKFKATPGQTIVQVRYHDFEAEDGGSSLGDEIDIQVGYKINDRLRGDFYYATFDGKNGISDTDKLWLQMSFAL
ncbi:MAG: alginate export family protein [Gammaproteobacteria bacterium]|nr:alginate export family protein [Gammaproteobacteria bacterium]